MDKFQFNYKLSAQTVDGDVIDITPPLSLDFDVQRSDLSSTNIASFRIYNLSELNRNQLRKDQFDGADLRGITLRAGYGQNMPIIFQGRYTQAWSVRESVDFITTLQCTDIGANGISQLNMAFPSGTSRKGMLTTIIGELASLGIDIGAIGNGYSGSLARANSFSGDAFQIIDELSGGTCFVDNGVMHCLADTECIGNEVLTVSSNSGLLGTPVREGLFLRFDMIFEPRLFSGQQVYLNSITFDDSRAGTAKAPNFNGFCKVISVSHKGMISESVASNVITSVGLSSGNFTKVATAT